MSRLVLVLSLLVAVSGLHAQEDDTTTTASAAVATRRVFRGVEQAGAGATGAFQVGRDGWQLGANISHPFDRDEPGEGDLTGAYVWKPTKLFKLEASVTPRWSINPLPGGTKHSFEAGVSAAWELPSGLTVELAGFHDWRLRADTVQATVNYSQPLKNLGAYLEWSASIGTSSARDLRPDAVGTPIRDSYSYYCASVRLPYRISSRSALVGGLHMAESDNQSSVWSPISSSGGFRVWFDLGLSVDF